MRNRKNSKVRSVEVTIEVNGVALKELYPPSAALETTSNTTVCFIEATPGTRYIITVRYEAASYRRDERFLVRAYVDGGAVDALYGDVQGKGKRTLQLGARRSYRKDLLKEEKLLFAKLVTTDETPTADLKDRVKELGDITVTIDRVRLTGKETLRVDSDEQKVKEIPEMALKGTAISTCTQFAEPFITQVDHRYTSDHELVYGERLRATYTFKYRSHHDLQVEGIIPRSPTPVPIEDRNPETLTAEEAREALRKLQATQAGTIRIKAEGVKRERSATHTATPDHLDAGDSEGEIGLEIVSSAPKRQRKIPVIDLTDD